MEIFYAYDSFKLLKEKFMVIGLKLKANEERTNEINLKILSLVKEDFLAEVSSKLNISDLFTDNNGNEFLNIYKDYFYISDDYFSEFFINKFFNPNNFNSVWAYKNKDRLLKLFPEFEEINFNENDLDKLKLSYAYHFIFDSYSDYPWGRSNLNIFFPDYFKRKSSGGDWKSNQKVRKFKFFKNYFCILDTFDKIDALNDQINFFTSEIERVENLNGIYYYIDPHKEALSKFKKEKERLEKLL